MVSPQPGVQRRPYGFRRHAFRAGTPAAIAGMIAAVQLLNGVLATAAFGAPATGAASTPTMTADRTVPTSAYFGAFSLYYDGDYEAALKAFEADARNAVKTSQSLWIDSICYETMCGECLFHMGMLKEALPRYTAALTLYKNFSDWMVHILQFSPTIRAAGANARKMVPWGVSKRQSQLGAYRPREVLYQGQIDMTNVLQQGGIMQQANGFPVVPQEIVRCTVLAIRRRATLLGPASKYDALTNDVIVAMNRAIGPANHWSVAWTNLERATALLAGGKDSQATNLLQQSVLAGGDFDHPLTSVALLELGQQALTRGDYPNASQFFEEATYAAVNYPDLDVLDEAFRGGMLAHLMANRKGMFPLLDGALQWAKRYKYRELSASLALLAAENYAILGETRPAAAMLDDARATVGRHSLAAGWIGARLSYLTALVAYQQKKTAEGDKALAVAMNYMQHGSLWLFHIHWADEQYLSGGTTPRMALDLFADVLRDPQPVDWASDPMESLADLTTPHPLEFDHWFDAALSRSGGNESQMALEISERARRNRFFSSLDLGGRLESLRWVLEAPPVYLPQKALLQRQELQAHFPAYQKLSQQAESLHAALAKMPLVVDEPAAIKEQSRQLADLAAIGDKQEALLREIAVRREPADMVFPPLRSLAEIQKAIPPRHAVLAFFATEKNLYGFLLNKERYAPPWRIGAPLSLNKSLQTMLHDLGQFQANHEMSVKDLADTKWKQSAQQLLELLLKGSQADLSQSFDELVVVPDGLLWYLPFESLQVSIDKQLQPIISRFRVRYAPTVSLCFSQGPGRSPTSNTAVVLGKLYPRDDDKVARAAFERLVPVVPGAVALRVPPPAASSIYSTLFQRLVVLDDMPPASEQDPYGWSPAPIDRGKAGGTLHDWLALPWGGPDVVVLPGFHTPAEDALKHEEPASRREDSLKRAHRNLPGNDMFLSVCGLMANGARTLLLSRWRTGGQTSFDLVREFTQELPRLSPADAWQRAVMLVTDSKLDLDAEPRVKRSTTEETPKSDHPFFWAGYMLVDCGTAPEKPEAKPEAPLFKVKIPEPPAEKVPPPPDKEPPAAEKGPPPAEKQPAAEKGPPPPEKPAEPDK